MRQEVGLRHPVYTRANETAPVRAQKLSRVDERRVQGLTGGGGGRPRGGLSLVRRTASTSLGVGTPPRRSALDSETRKRDREVPRHEDEILSDVLRANIRFRVRKDHKRTFFSGRARSSGKNWALIHFEEDRSPLGNRQRSIVRGQDRSRGSMTVAIVDRWTSRPCDNIRENQSWSREEDRFPINRGWLDLPEEIRLVDF